MTKACSHSHWVSLTFPTEAGFDNPRNSPVCRMSRGPARRAWVSPHVSAWCRGHLMSCYVFSRTQQLSQGCHTKQVMTQGAGATSDQMQRGLPVPQLSRD